jgi:hypothetical protein
MPAAQSKIFDSLVPFFRSFDGDHPPTGLSLIAIGRKAAGDAEALRAETAAAVTV